MSELIRMKSFDQGVDTTMQTNIKLVMERKRYHEIEHFFRNPRNRKLVNYFQWDLTFVIKKER